MCATESRFGGDGIRTRIFTGVEPDGLPLTYAPYRLKVSGDARGLDRRTTFNACWPGEDRFAKGSTLPACHAPQSGASATDGHAILLFTEA